MRSALLLLVACAVSGGCGANLGYFHRDSDEQGWGPLNPSDASNTAFLGRRSKRAIIVVGGEKAREAEFAYMVAIGYRKQGDDSSVDLRWGCGGSLISDRYVLTAAHCITDPERDNLRPVAMRMGATKLSRGPQLPGDYSVESITPHPRHHRDFKYFDLALLRTDRAVHTTRAVRRVRLPRADTRVDANSVLVVAGWGAINPAGTQPTDDLQKAELRLVELEECKKLIHKQRDLPRGVDDSMICAKERNRDTCKGDSGGPLAVREPQGDVLVGVTSFGGRPCAGTRPGVYARVQAELQWIESIIKS